jgi:hypothetical protein
MGGETKNGVQETKTMTFPEIGGTWSPMRLKIFKPGYTTLYNFGKIR